MSNKNRLPGTSPWRRLLMMATVATMVATLSACGGDHSAGGAMDSVAKAAGAQSGASDAAQTSAASTFFDGIFNTASGSGYYIFGWNSMQSVETGGALGETGITRTRFGVLDGNDTTLRQSYVPQSGNDSLQYSKVVYITAEGAFSADTLPYDDLGPHTKIFQREPDGFDFGVQGMSTPLYRVTLDVRDVSGQTVKSVVKLFQGGDPIVYVTPLGALPLDSVDRMRPRVDYVANPLTVNMPRLVFPSSNTTLMPGGSQLFVPTYTVQTRFLRVDLSRLVSTMPNAIPYKTLEDYSRFRPVGQIDTLGDYRYGRPAGTGWGENYFGAADSKYVVEYQGQVYPADLLSVGDQLTAPVIPSIDNKHLAAPRPAFNKVAAAFLTRQLGSSPTQTHDLMYRSTDCYSGNGSGWINQCNY